ncbi:MAG: glutamate-5-semialdehyde dehydrogenase [Candidatus Fimivicinus sp.]|nr:glutamate-5-semialdehyde dehydrogenase [Oscillospiraceae bacterium]MDY5590865.1 glutamate-5-semialdehyde dehydrogenase [Candidatus Fimivicinus sp.]
MTALEQMGQRAKEAERFLRTASTACKDKGLVEIADALMENCDAILEANTRDIANGEKAGMSAALLDRLRLSQARIAGMAQGVRDIIALADPVGRVLAGGNRPNGLQIVKVAVPLGVVAVIFEARPNVTADAAALCLKSGNAVILRGGKEAIHSNRAIAGIMRRALEKAELPQDCIQLVEDTSRDSANELMRLNGYVDVLIPRGGSGLIRAVVEHASVPVIETGVGNCHVYVDQAAEIGMAADIVFNAKTSRPSVCNACESLLVHRDIAEQALPAIKRRLDDKQVILRGDKAARAILPGIEAAQEADWGTEYLDYILSVKVVDSIDEAIAHIGRYGSGHSECIVTQSYAAAEQFLNEVDAAAVYVNASTRFTDGGEFGFGAEIGISTQKLHARGPLGLNELTSVKYKIYGTGQIR